MKKAVLAIAAVLGVIVVVAVLVLGNINSIMQQGIETLGPEILGAPVEVASVDVSFLSGTGEITGLRVANPEGYSGDHAIAIERIHIELDPMSVTSDKLKIYKIVIDAPSIAYSGNLQDSNIQQLQRNASSFGGSTDSKTADPAAQTEQAADAGQSVEIALLEVNDVDLSVALSFLGDKPLSLTLPSMTMKDIGKDQDMDMAAVLQAVLKNLNSSILPLIKDNAGDIGSQLKQQGEKLEDSLKKGVDKLKSMFKR